MKIYLKIDHKSRAYRFEIVFNKSCREEKKTGDSESVNGSKKTKEKSKIINEDKSK